MLALYRRLAKVAADAVLPWGCLAVEVAHGKLGNCGVLCGLQVRAVYNNMREDPRLRYVI